MLLGLDVGGTFTDAVIISGGQVAAYAKTPTTHSCLLECITTVLDQVLSDIHPQQLQRVSLSTTIVTNALVRGKLAQAGLVIMPGPGVDIAPLLPVVPVVVPGCTNHCGRETELPDEQAIRAAAAGLSGCRLLAVSGKFAVRNRSQERYVARRLQQMLTPAFIVEAAELSSTLNFWRRTNSAYYNAAVWPCFDAFVQAVEHALAVRGVVAPVCILKADGGAVALAAAKAMPIEAVFTGPAASVLGIMAMTPPSNMAVSLDIGGTTTDIALWQEGVPLRSKQGIAIQGFPTAVRGFLLHSVGIGGDSHVVWDGETLAIGPERHGPAMALGGSYPTLSDALIVAGRAAFGDGHLAVEAMDKLAAGRMDAASMAQQVVDGAVQTICEAISQLIADWNDRPVYRVDDINNVQAFAARCIVGVGGAAGGLAPAVAGQLGLDYTVPAGSEVVNAVGAAVARPTMTATMRADTVDGSYCIAEEGVRRPLASRAFGWQQASALAVQYLQQQAAVAGILPEDIQTLDREEFHVVRNSQTVGSIMTGKLQIVSGVLSQITGFEPTGRQHG